MRLWILIAAALACDPPRPCLETREIQHAAYDTVELDSASFLLLGIPLMRTVHVEAWTETVCVRYAEMPR